MTREDAALALRDLAAKVREADPDAAATRLLERIAETTPELRDALVEVGALALMREARS